MEWLSYLFKVTLCMTLFYAVYFVLLQKLTFFSTNRLYLLTTLLLSFAIPTLTLTVKSDRLTPPTVIKKNQSEVVVSGLRDISQIETAIFRSSAEKASGTRIDWLTILNYSYWIVATIILLTSLAHLGLLLWHTRKVVAISGPLKLVQKTGRYTNCSFLNYVFIDHNELDKDTLSAIVRHEGVHASQYHSLDKLLLALCKALLWFSPLVYLYSLALEQVHEYEADRETSIQIGDTKYANLLLKLAVSTAPAPLVHSFVKNPLKARIKMLFINQSKNMNKLTYLSLIPAGLALVWSFSVKVVYAQGKPSQKETVKAITESLSSPSPIVSGALSGESISEPIRPSPITTEEAADTPVRLVDHAMLGDDPWVIIDGKKYTAEILTKISPSCIKQSRLSVDKAVITTINNRVEYATKAEIATARIRKRMKGNGKFYSRYPVTINGHKHDEILIRTDGASSEASFPVGYRAMLLIEGKVYTETEAKALPTSMALNITGLRYRYADDDPEVKSLCGEKCDVLIEVKKRRVTGPNDVEVTRNASSVLSLDALGRLYYSSKDSVVATIMMVQ